MPDGFGAGGRADFLIQTSQRVVQIKGAQIPAAGAGLRAIPPFIFHPDMPKGDTGADQERQNNERRK